MWRKSRPRAQVGSLKDVNNWLLGRIPKCPQPLGVDDDQPLTKLIATADRITAVASKRELDLLTEVSLAGRTNGGKSTLFSALAGPGAPCTSTSSSTTNCVITFLGDESAEGYTAHVTVQSAEDLLADVLAAVKEYHLEVQPRKKHRELEYLQNIFGEAVYQVLDAAKPPPIEAGADEQQQQEHAERLEEQAAQLRARTMQTAAYRLAERGSCKLGPKHTAEEVMEELQPYLYRMRGIKGQRVECTWIICKQVDIVGRCKAEEMYNILVKDYPGLGDINKVLIKRAEAGAAEDFKLLVVDGQRPDEQIAGAALREFLNIYVPICHRLGENKVMVVYTKIDMWGEDVFRTIQHDETVHRMKADLEEARAKRREAEDARQLAGLRRRGETDSETAAAAERAVATWQARVAEKEKAYMRQLRIVVTRFMDEEVQRQAQEVADMCGVQAPPRIPVFFVNAKHAIELEQLLAAEEEKAKVVADESTMEAIRLLQRDVNATGIPKLRRHIAAYKKEREMRAELETFLDFCTLVPERYSELLSAYMSSQRDVAEQLSEFDRRSGQRIEAALTAACGEWLQEAHHACVEAAPHVDNLVPQVVDSLRDFLRTDKEGEERGGRGAMAAAPEGDTARHWLDLVRLDHLRRYATQPPSMKKDIMQQLLQQLQLLMDECWKPCVKERLAALVRALHSARPALGGVYKALSEAVRESLEEYTDQHGPCNHMKASVNQAVRGVFSRAHGNLQLKEGLDEVLGAAYSRAVEQHTLQWFVAAVQDTNEAYPVRRNVRVRDAYVNHLTQLLTERAEDMVKGAAGKLKAEIDTVYDWLEEKLLGASGAAGGGNAGAAASAAADPSNGNAASGGTAGGSSNGSSSSNVCLVQQLCSRLGGIFVELRPEKVGYGQCRQTILHLRTFSRQLLRAYVTYIVPYLNSDAQQQASVQEGSGGGAGPSGSGASGAAGPGGSGTGAVPHAEPEATGEVRTQWQLLQALLVGRQDEIEEKMEGLRQMEEVAAQQEQQQQPAGAEAAAAEAGAEDIRQEGSDGENAGDQAAGDIGGEHSGLQQQGSAAYRTRAKKRESEAQSEGPGSAAGTPVKRGKRETGGR